MSTTPPTPSGHEGRLNELIAAYLEADQAGCPPDRDEWLARHPEHAGELRQFLDAHQRLARLGAPLRAAAPLGVVRYFGDYELIEEIGRGGMGVVYRARQVSLNRVVALKMILAGQLASAEEVQRFRHEAENAANLDHPHIVAVYEIGSHDGQHYYAMRHVEGGSLDRHLSRFRDDPRGAARLLATIARAVHHAHQRQVLHRDLKPGNVLLDVAGEPHVTDLGLARRFGPASGSQPGSGIVGTPQYMAPEQAAARPGLTTAVDVYGLGAVLYALLTGRPPFRAGSAYETLLRVLEEAPESPRQLNPAIDADLATVCLKCLEKEPAHRYGSAEALAEDLECWLRGEPVLARRVGPGERLVKWVRRRPGHAGLLASLVLVAAVGLVGILWQWARTEDQRRRAEAQGQRAVRAAEAEASAHARERQRRREARRAATLLLMERGVVLCQGGQVEQGIHSFVRALEQLDNEEPDLERSLRLLVAGWGPLLHPLRAVLPLCPQTEEAPQTRAVGFSPDSRTVATLSDRDVRLWQAGTGQAIGKPLVVQGRLFAFSRDSRRLLVVTDQKALHLLDARTAATIVPAPMHPGPIQAVVFTPTGDLLAAGEDRKVYRWRPGTAGAGEVPALPGDWLAFSADGALVAVQTRAPAVLVLDTTRLLPRGKPLPGKTGSVEFSPDGSTVLIDAGPGWRAWDVATGTPRGKPLRAAAVVLSPDGRAAAGITDEVTVRLFDTKTGQPLGEPMEHVRQVNRVLFDPAGRSVLTTTLDSEVFLWGPRSGGSLGRPLLHRNRVCAAAFSPDGRTVLTADLFDTQAYLWDVARRSPVGKALRHPGGVDRLVVSPDAARLLSASAGKPRPEVTVRLDGGGPRMPGLRGHLHPADQARLWDLASGKLLSGPLGDGPVRHLATDARHFLVADQQRSLRLWDVVAAGPVGQAPPLAAEVYSPDGKRAVELPRNQAGQRSVARLLDTRTGQQVGQVLRHPGAILAAAFSSDGSALVTAGTWDHPELLPIHNWDGSEEYLQKMKRREKELRQRGEVLHRGEAAVWLAANGARRGEVLTFPTPIREVRLSSGARMALLVGDEGLWCLDLDKGTTFASEVYRHGRVRELSPDGRYALLMRQGGAARLWDLHRGRPAGEPLRNPGALDQVAFSPSGRLLLVVNETARARFWDTLSGLPVGLPLPHRQVNAVAVTPDGSTCLTAGEDGRVLRWRVAEPVRGSPRRVRLWAEVHTALATDDSGALDALTWQRRDQLWQELQREPRP